MAGRLRRLEQEPATRSPHAKALSRLLAGRGDRRTSELLQLALVETDAEPDDAWSDLSAALLLEEYGEGDVLLLAEALEAVERALEENPAHVRALFNRGLVLERLLLDRAATDAWQRYLEVETDDGWRQEAEHHLRLLESRLAQGPDDEALWRSLTSPGAHEAAEEVVREYPSRVRAAFFDRLLPSLRTGSSFAEACGNEIAQWRSIGQAFAEHFDDRLLADASSWLLELCAMEPARRAQGEAGLEALTDGLEMRRSSRAEEAVEQLELASDLLDDVESPLALVAEVYRATSLLAANHYEAARELGESLLGKLAAEPYRQLRARNRWLLGTIAFRSRAPEPAADLYAAALDDLGTGSDPEEYVVLQSIRAEALGANGRFAAAWEAGFSALRGARELRAPASLFGVCQELSSLAALLEERRLAVLYAECAVDNAEARGDPAYAADAFVWSSLALGRIGDVEAAAERLARAERAALEIRDSRERGQTLADIEIVRGSLLAEDDPSAAEAALAEAASYYEAVGNYIHLSLLRLLRADVLRALGKPAEAAAELASVELLQEQQRDETATPLGHLGLLARASTVTDRQVALLLEDLDDGLAALAAADRPKRLGRGAETADVDAMAAALDSLPAGVGVAAYSWLDGRIAGWWLERGEAPRVFRAEEALDPRLVRAAAVPGRTAFPGGARAVLAELFDALLRPVGDRLSSVDRIVVVPDGPLYAVPFPALFDDQAGEYLIEKVAVAVAPSLLRPRAPARSDGLAERSSTIAVFADPAVPAEGASVYLPLPRAREEALGIGEALGRETEIFAGTAATAEALLSALLTREHVHFGGHGEIDAGDPTRSALVLAPDPDHPTGRVTAAELYELEAVGLELAVFASCGSAGMAPFLPNSLALVRPLLENGANTVVGSLRPLGDDLFGELMHGFYSAIGAGAAPAAALRMAQREVIEREASGPDGEQVGLPAWGFVEVFEYVIPIR